MRQCSGAGKRSHGSAGAIGGVGKESEGPVQVTREVCVDSSPPRSLKGRGYPSCGLDDWQVPCPDGGIGRRTSFRCWRSQGRGGSSPLLGTNTLKKNTKSSQARSSDRVCYGLLLRFGAQNSGSSVSEREKNSPRGCYGFSHGLLPRGMMLRGGRFYLRRHVPTDIQSIIGRAEVWRSLKTDSLQTALRRLPLAPSVIESALERR